MHITFTIFGSPVGVASKFFGGVRWLSCRIGSDNGLSGWPCSRCAGQFAL